MKTNRSLIALSGFLLTLTCTVFCTVFCTAAFAAPPSPQGMQSLMGRLLLESQQNSGTRLVLELAPDRTVKLEGVILGNIIRCTGKAELEPAMARLYGLLNCNRPGRPGQDAFTLRLGKTDWDLLRRGYLTRADFVFQSRATPRDPIHTVYSQEMDLKKLDVLVL